VTEQFRREEPVKNTIHNRVQTFGVKLNSAPCELYQDDAAKDGFDDCADAFVPSPSATGSH
jgi:hypothetical protein